MLQNSKYNCFAMLEHRHGKGGMNLGTSNAVLWTLLIGSTDAGGGGGGWLQS